MLLRITNNVPIIWKHQKYRAEVAAYGRGGTKSPESLVYYLAGQRYTAFAFKRIGMQIDVVQVLKDQYSLELLSRFVYAKNPLMARLSKKEGFFGGGYFRLPFTGEKK